MEYVLPLLMLAAGLSIGGAGVWLLSRGKTQHAYQRGQADSRVQQAAIEERLHAREQAIEQLRAELDARQCRLDQAQRELTVLGRRESELQMQLSETRRQAQEKLAVLDEAQKKLADAFKALAADALKHNNQSFLELAKTNLETFQKTAQTDLDQRRKAIDELVLPVKLSLEKFDVKLQDVEKARIDAYRGVTEQVKLLSDSNKQLKTETAELVGALKKPQVRGRWGEIQLRRVVELAGMLDHCDFHEQQSSGDDAQRLRPDMIVHLPANKTIVVDSKAPLAAFLEAVEARDEASRAERLQAHARNVRNRIKELSSKAYFDQFEHSPEFVVLFLPGESLFSAAVEQDPLLIEAGADLKVVVSSPTTLIAMLKAVYHGWRQERLADNARQISDLGRDLFDRLATMGGHLSKLGRSLQSATNHFNDTVGSLESRVLVSARRFKELDAAPTGAELPAIQTIDLSARRLQATELTDQEDTPVAGAVRQFTAR